MHGANDSLTALSFRVAQLEKSRRRWQRFGTALALATLATLLSGARKDSRIRASAFELRDSAGRLRAEIALDTKGSPGLNLLDSAGTPRVRLGMDALGYPSLELDDPDGAKRVSLGFDTDGSPGLDVLGRDGRERFVLGLDEQQLPVINILDGEGLMRSYLGFEAGNPTFWLGNSLRGVRFSAGDDARIAITDGYGKDQLLLRGRNAGSAIVQLNHADESAILDHERVVFLKGTTEIWAAPTPPAPSPRTH